MNYSKDHNSRVIIPAELRPDFRAPGLFSVEGRLSVVPGVDGGLTTIVFNVEKLVPLVASPKGPQPNIHDHARSDDPHNPSAYGRHDHEAPPWGAAHRHINSLRSPAVPAVVVGCTNVGHDKVDCFAAGVDHVKLCPACQRALGRSFR